MILSQFHSSLTNGQFLKWIRRRSEGSRTASNIYIHSTSADFLEEKSLTEAENGIFSHSFPAREKRSTHVEKEFTGRGMGKRRLKMGFRIWPFSFIISPFLLLLFSFWIKREERRIISFAFFEFRKPRKLSFLTKWQHHFQIIIASFLKIPVPDTENVTEMDFQIHKREIEIKNSEKKLAKKTGNRNSVTPPPPLPGTMRFLDALYIGR